jgi:heat shock protein beta
MPPSAAAAEKEGEEAEAAEQSEAEKKLEERSGAFTKFWNSFGKSVKMGVIEDQSNR